MSLLGDNYDRTKSAMREKRFNVLKKRCDIHTFPLEICPLILNMNMHIYIQSYVTVSSYIT